MSEKETTVEPKRPAAPPRLLTPEKRELVKEAQHRALYAAIDAQELTQYGDFWSDVGKITDVMIGKVRQGTFLPAAAGYVVTVINERDSIEEFEPARAAATLEQRAAARSVALDGLSAVLFRGTWPITADGRYWLLWENSAAQVSKRLPPPLVAIVTHLENPPQLERRRPQ